MNDAERKQKGIVYFESVVSNQYAMCTRGACKSCKGKLRENLCNITWLAFIQEKGDDDDEEKTKASTIASH